MSTFEPLHPAPSYGYAADYREAHDRDQLREPSDLAQIWRRAVEALAADLCIEPIEAHDLLVRAGTHVSIGVAWDWWS